MNWRTEAACLNADPEIFYPDQSSTATAVAAKRVCRGCAVRSECLSWAIDNDETEGVWGGMSAGDRQRLRRGRRRAA